MIDDEKLKNCMLRLLLCLDEFKTVEKADLNDLEIAKDELYKELRLLIYWRRD